MTSDDRRGDSRDPSPTEPVAAPAPGADPADPRIGTVVDRYTIVRRLGQGGMGTVYEARHAKLARRFAIKFLLPELAASADALRRFENEAKTAGGLEHPHLVAVTDFGRASDGAPYLVMEFLEGEDCAALLGRLGPLPIPRAVDIVLQACRGLSVAHKAGVVHRDLKPENLFVCDAGDGSDLIKVLDFGIAKLRPSESGATTGSGTTFGTAYYMSPEQARGASDIDQRADVWSLGVVLYELLAGRRPFEGEQFLHVIHEILTVEPTPLAALRSDVPPGLALAVSRALTRDAGQRPATVAAWAALLAAFSGRGTPADVPRPRAAGAAPTVATPATHAGIVVDGVPPARARSRRFRMALGLVAVVAVAVSVGVARLSGRRAGDAGRAPTPAAVVVPAAAPGPAVPPPPSSVVAPVAATGPSAAPLPAVAAPPASVRPASVRSEPGAARPNKRKAPVRTVRTGRGAASVPAEHPDKPAIPLAPAVGERPIEIEKANPYGP